MRIISMIKYCSLYVCDTKCLPPCAVVAQANLGFRFRRMPFANERDIISPIVRYRRIRVRPVVERCDFHSSGANTDRAHPWAPFVGRAILKDTSKITSVIVIAINYVLLRNGSRLSGYSPSAAYAMQYYIILLSLLWIRNDCIVRSCDCNIIATATGALLSLVFFLLSQQLFEIFGESDHSYGNTSNSNNNRRLLIVHGSVSNSYSARSPFRVVDNVNRLNADGALEIYYNGALSESRPQSRWNTILYYTAIIIIIVRPRSVQMWFV